MNRKKELLFLLGVTAIVVIIWIIASIIQTKPSEEVSSELQTALEPLSPNFDQTTLNKINQLNPLSTPAPTTAPTPSPTPTPTPSPSPTPPPLEEQLSPLLQATPSGEGTGSAVLIP